MPRTEQAILFDIKWVDIELEPERLFCDGELSHSAGMVKASQLNTKKRKLMKELGRIPTDREVWEVAG